MSGRSRRISTKLIAAVSAAVAAISIVATAIQWAQRESAVSHSLSLPAGEVDATIDAALRDAMVKADAEMLAGVIGRVRKMTAVKRIYLLDQTGRVPHTSDETMPQELVHWRCVGWWKASTSGGRSTRPFLGYRRVMPCNSSATVWEAPRSGVVLAGSRPARAVDCPTRISVSRKPCGST